MTTASTTIAARLDRLPKSRYIRRLIVLISLGGCFELYDLFFTAYIALGLFKSAIFTPTTKALFGLEGFASFVAALFAGLFVGTIVFSRLSDRFGRRSIFTFSLLWYSVCTLIMAFQSTAMAIDIWRFIASVGIGVELVNIDTYVSELVPRESRGRAFAFNQTIAFIAVPVVALISTLLVPITVLGHDGWRWVVGIGSIGAVFIWFIRLGLPESPRWLAQRGRLDEADKVMTGIENKVRAETGRELPPPRVVAGETEEKHGAWIEMWQGVYFGRTIMMSAYNFLQTIGYYGFATWVPTLLIQQGITVTKSLEYTFIIAIANPFGPLLGTFFADYLERKTQIVLGLVVMGVSMLGFARVNLPAVLIALGVVFTLAANVMSYAYHNYQAELYPTRIRARAVGFVYSWSRIAAAFAGLAIGYFLNLGGALAVATFIAIAMVVGITVIGVFGPSTKGVALEHISH